MSKKAGKKKSKKRIRIALVIIAFLALLSAAGYTVFIAPLLKKDQWIYKETQVQRGTLAVGVTESGSITYGVTQLQYALDMETDDDDEDDEEETVKYLKIEEVYVTAGQKIAKGDALIKLSEESITGARRQLESALVEAKTEFNEAQADYELSALEAKLDYESSLIDSKYAKAIYQNSTKSISGDLQTLKTQLAEYQAQTASLEEKLAEAREGIDELQKKYEEAKAFWEATSTNEPVNYAYSQKNYLNAQSAYQNAKDQIKQAQQSLENNQEQIASLKKQINSASAAKSLNDLQVDETYQESVLIGENAKVVYDSTVEGLKDDLQKAQETLDAAQKRLDDFEAFVGEDGILYASENGIITEVSCTAGQTLNREQSLVAYAKPDEMTISVDVTQEDIINLVVGDKVSITFTAYADAPYVGVIQSIETTATSRNTNTVSYTVVVAIEGDTDGLYGGMTADIVFVMEEKEDVLYVSRKAIIEEDGTNYVYVKGNDGKMDRKVVQIGITNGVNTEILEGLKEGDVIYLASKVSSQTDVTSATPDADADTNGSDVRRGSDGGGMPDFGNMPSDGSMPDFGNMPGGGSMPDFGNMPSGGSMPDFGSMPSGGMPGGPGR